MSYTSREKWNDEMDRDLYAAKRVLLITIPACAVIVLAWLLS